MNLNTFLAELKVMNEVAEKTLKDLEVDLNKKRDLFAVFSEQMLAIRGTAQQLNLGDIAEFAALGEEISIRAVKAKKISLLRRSMDALWDVLTTVKLLVEKSEGETSEERNYLKERLSKLLESLGGSRPTFTNDDIEQLLRDKASQGKPPSGI